MSDNHQQFLDQLPDDAPDFGELQEVYPKFKGDRTSLGSLVYGIFGLVGCAAVVWLVSAARHEAEQDPDNDLPAAAQYAMYGFAAFFGGSGLFYLVRAVVLRRKSVTAVGRYWLVFEGGLLILRKGELEGAYPNKEFRITKLPKRMTARPDRKLANAIFNKVAPDEYGVKDRAGNKIRLPLDFPGPNAMIRQIYKNMTDELIPKMQRKLEQGKSVSFGGVKVFQKGIIYEGDTYPFEKISKIRIFAPNEMDDRPWDALRIDLLSSSGDKLTKIEAYSKMYNIWLFIKLVLKLAPDSIPQKKSTRDLVF